VSRIVKSELNLIYSMHSTMKLPCLKPSSCPLFLSCAFSSTHCVFCSCLGSVELGSPKTPVHCK
jgi:hypothetical protein